MTLAIETMPGETPIIWMTVIRTPLGEPLRACVCPHKSWCFECMTSQVTRFLAQERKDEKCLDYLIMKVSYGIWNMRTSL